MNLFLKKIAAMGIDWFTTPDMLGVAEYSPFGAAIFLYLR